MKKFIFYYFSGPDQEKVMQTGPQHGQYWAPIKTAGGPFADYTGGFVIFEAESLEEAKELVENDPFVKNKLLGENTLKEWLQIG